MTESTYVAVSKTTVDADTALRNKLLNRSNSEIIDQVRVMCLDGENKYIFEVHSDDLNRTDVFDSYEWHSKTYLHKKMCCGELTEATTVDLTNSILTEDGNSILLEDSNSIDLE